MTITLKIDNPDVEKQLKQFVREQKEITLEALSSFVNTFQKNEPVAFPKKDPARHSRSITYAEDDGEDLREVKPYAHINDSAQYVHDLRRKRV